MKILLDQGTPAPLSERLTGHDVKTAYQLHWSKLTNGDLLAAAERSGYNVLVTTDQNLKYQQNLVTRRIAIVVLLTTSWPRIREQTELIREVVENLSDGDYQEIEIP
jgi:predicted nuclease of predicted toxin-antitoxin system